jgi:hypothetical protein
MIKEIICYYLNSSIAAGITGKLFGKHLESVVTVGIECLLQQEEDISVQMELVKNESICYINTRRN